MDVERADELAARIAAAIGEPARTRMLYCLLDNRARTSTELAVVAGVSPSTASVHLNRLRDAHLVKVLIQGKHRYYSLEGAGVANVLEGLSVLAGDARQQFTPSTPSRLRTARTCYDHIAGSLGVLLHDTFAGQGWLTTRDDLSTSIQRRAGEVERQGNRRGVDLVYDLTDAGATAFEALGIDVGQCRQMRRRFAFACLDWSERRYHIGGAIGSELLKISLKRRWVRQDLDGRALSVTDLGRRELLTRFGLRV
jgi:DNA-binding transcriptional ArsR family regulator